jgi:hypothetical protein
MICTTYNRKIDFHSHYEHPVNPMPSPFPGMNPYLEHPSAWPNVHHRLITAIADDLAPQLLPKYQVLVEERIYQVETQDSILVGAPDVLIQQLRSDPETGTVALATSSIEPLSVTLTLPETLRQGYLEVREITTGQVITVIEVLSPVNKRSGKGRLDYENKRAMILTSSSNFVEIDLLRQGQSMPIQANLMRSQYRILVSSEEKRPQADLYAFNLPDPIPCFTLPLRAGDRLPTLDLRWLLNGIYDRSGYGFVIDYTQPPIPPLTESDLLWMNQSLKISRPD